MKRFLLLSCLAWRMAAAQITITVSDMPQLNDTARYSTSTTDISSKLAQTGASQTWDFSSLVPDFQDMATFKSAASINVAYLLSFGSSSFGSEGAGFSLGAAQSTSLYNFYKRSSSSYACDGRGFELSASPLPVSQTYTGKDIIYRFPLTYGNADTSTYQTSQANIVVATLGGSGRRINHVDGWGTLITPFGNYSCVRVKSDVVTVDTLHVQTLAIPVTQTYTEYKWLANGHKIPLLEVRVQATPTAQTTIKYKDMARPELFAGLANFTTNKTMVAANSNDTIILTDISGRNPASRTWDISPGTFTFTGGTNASSNPVKVFFSDTGRYSVKLTVHYNAGQDDTLRSNLISVVGAPHARFSCSTQSTAPGNTVNFYDSSTGAPTQWHWSFNPGTVSFLGGSSASSKNPQVSFDQPGQYSVSLKVSNSVGADSLSKINYITCLSTGIAEAKGFEKRWSITPNPADEQFSIVVSRSSVKAVEVLDLTGKLLTLPQQWTAASNLEMNSSQLRPGMYFVRIQFSNGDTESKRISIR